MGLISGECPQLNPFVISLIFGLVRVNFVRWFGASWDFAFLVTATRDLPEAKVEADDYGDTRLKPAKNTTNDYNIELITKSSQAQKYVLSAT
jgi:hypothetical protein